VFAFFDHRICFRLLRFAGAPFLAIPDSPSGSIGGLSDRLLGRCIGGYRELHESMNIAIVAAMALSKFPFLILQAGALLRTLASARLSR
jgi:hypothetical protein